MKYLYFNKCIISCSEQCEADGYIDRFVIPNDLGKSHLRKTSISAIVRSVTKSKYVDNICIVNVLVLRTKFSLVKLKAECNLSTK